MEDFQIQDDLNLAEMVHADTGPKPPLPGNYMFKPLKWQMRHDKAGKMILWNNGDGVPTYPILSLTTAEIVDPIDNARKVVLFQDIPTSPFQREGKTASRAADLLIAIDATAAATNSGEVIRLLSERLNGEIPFRARLDYEGYDKTAAAQFVSELGPSPDKKAKREAYDKAKIRGYKKIAASNQKNGQPTLPLHKWVGPSGNVIECSPVLTVFFPSDETVTLSADKFSK